MNTLPNVYKLFHFNLTMSPLYLVKLKIAQKQPTACVVRSVEQIVLNFRTKSFSVLLFLCLFENSFSSLLTKIVYILMGFYQKTFFKFNMVNFNMYT